ncbi:hypothetical protein PFISCL1PPCAC_5384, partial [Pristionchus fissidentatus]
PVSTRVLGARRVIPHVTRNHRLVSLLHSLNRLHHRLRASTVMTPAASKKDDCVASRTRNNALRRVTSKDTISKSKPAPAPKNTRKSK